MPVRSAIARATADARRWPVEQLVPARVRIVVISPVAGILSASWVMLVRYRSRAHIEAQPHSLVEGLAIEDFPLWRLSNEIKRGSHALRGEPGVWAGLPSALALRRAVPLGDEVSLLFSNCPSCTMYWH